MMRGTTHRTSKVHSQTILFFLQTKDMLGPAEDIRNLGGQEGALEITKEGLMSFWGSYLASMWLHVMQKLRSGARISIPLEDKMRGSEGAKRISVDHTQVQGAPELWMVRYTGEGKYKEDSGHQCIPWRCVPDLQLPPPLLLLLLPPLLLLSTMITLGTMLTRAA